MQKFSAFDPILIRMNRMDEWTVDFYDRPHHECDEHWTITGSIIIDKNILPYNEETKHLHGTIGEFVKWEPKKGEPILVRNNDNEDWLIRIFVEKRGKYFTCVIGPETECTVVWPQAKPYINPFKE